MCYWWTLHACSLLFRQHSADFGALRPYSHNYILYILITWCSTGILKMHVYGSLLQRMNIPWSLEDQTAPVTVESGCRNYRTFLVGSQHFPSLWPGPRELLLLMANSSVNSRLCLCAGHSSRETLALLLGFDLKWEKWKREYRNWWEEGYESLKAKVS